MLRMFLYKGMTNCSRNHQPFSLNRNWIGNPTQRPKFSQVLALKMSTQSNSKRPICPNCAKPIRVCLCNRIENPGLENPVRVTILQHSLEKKHPLNSARIIRLGLKNVTVVNVSSVDFEARLDIRLLGSDMDTCVVGEDMKSRSLGVCENVAKSSNFVLGSEVPVITATIGKKGFNSSVNCRWIPQMQSKKPDFDQLLANQEAVDALAKGFDVKRFQKRELNGSKELIEDEEFELEVPTGSILLFPTDKAMSVEDVEAANFEVKNLIVLDGTWAKAKRLYKENPWLKVLPHLKLNLDKMSLYGEVRSQPKAGCLSTIESVVYALKALGDDSEGLDNLLDVFESMVGDQRLCKDERLSEVSQM